MEVVELHHGYQFREHDFVEEGIPVVKIRNVIGQGLELSDLTYVSKNRLLEFSDVVIKNGDLLMSLTGNIGRVVEVTGIAIPMLQNYRVGKFVPKGERLLKSFAKFLLSSEHLLKQLNQLANQSAQSNFGKQDMDKLKVKYPESTLEQMAISSLLQKHEQFVNVLTRELSELKAQKKGLMQQLLMGKVRVKI